MNGKHKFLKDASHAFAGLVLSLLMGIVGGGICGTVILGFGGLIGRSGTTGTEYFGYWSADFIWLGVVYGGIFGAFVGPIAYPFLVRKIGFPKSILPAFLGTIVGGFVGAVAAPPVAVLTGICGFFLALVWARIKLAKTDLSENQ